MKYYRENTLIIEYPTTTSLIIGCPLPARIKWAVAWTELGGDDKVRFVYKGMLLKGKHAEKGYHSRKNLILIDLNCTKETFIDEVTRFFSQKLNVNPQALTLRFEKFQPFGDLNE